MVKNVIVLDGYDKHFVLFVKGYYGRVGGFEDKLPIVVGYLCGIAKEKITINDVYELVSETFVKLCVAHPEHCMKLFLKNIFSHSGSVINKFDVIKEMLDSLSALRIYDDGGNIILKIGKPDPKLKQLLDW